MENKNFLIGLALLLVGVAIGYFIAVSQTHSSPTNQKMSAEGEHQMEDGTMMQNDASMSEAMHAMTGSLDGKTGDVFDETFIEEMIIHHEGAVDMAEAALKNAKHTEIKKLAGEIIAAQTKEINQMKEWLKVWYSK